MLVVLTLYGLGKFGNLIQHALGRLEGVYEVEWQH